MVMIVYLDKIYTTKTTTSGWGAVMVMIVYLDKIYTTKTTTSGWGAIMDNDGHAGPWSSSSSMDLV
jgi:hypothetical protein